MAFSRLKQYLCHILTLVFDMGDGDLFHAHRQAADRADDPWLAFWTHFFAAPQLETARPQIGGNRITIDWLRALEPRECLYQFRYVAFMMRSMFTNLVCRLYADELIHLAAAMDIPEIFRTRNRCAFPRVEALALLLARFKSAGDEFDLTMRYARSQAAISELVNELSMFLDERWGHLLDFDTNGLLSPARMQEYADAIHAKGAPLDSVWGLLDCTIRGICRPSRWQQIAYNGYKKIHAIKFQAIKLPNGLIGHLFGPMEGRRNDNALLAAPHLLENCAQCAFRPRADHNTPITRRYFQIFGDPAYGVSPLLLSPFNAGADRTPEQTKWSHAMSSVRMEVEHGFGGITREWPFLNAWWKLRVYSSPVGRYYRVCVLLANALNCIRPNQTSQAFDILPPHVHEYFHN
ncbi:DDE Tnp4 domain-containing protein [Mycena venus]|uniref:DDE Tnp4 domain-containing protein n=1 Tax=Mycena venus TaxID=2733690 RepID=A0A8H6X955_9AGAR|nr:DDE Tnp4 domain-containing protein [Mycena venus]